jgi:hypothetical protein
MQVPDGLAPDRSSSSGEGLLWHLSNSSDNNSSSSSLTAAVAAASLKHRKRLAADEMLQLHGISSTQ